LELIKDRPGINPMNQTLDSVLQRQLKRIGIGDESAPAAETWLKFLSTVNEHYTRLREDRTLLMRSMDISTGEMDQLRRQVETQRDSLRTLLNTVSEAIDTFGQAVRQRKVQSDDESTSVSVASIRSAFSARLEGMFDVADESNEVSAIRANLFRLADQLVSLLAEAGERAEAEKELELARVAQQLLMPRAGAGSRGMRMASIFQPAAACGGDFWNVQALDTDRTMVVVGDVTGHGVAAALVTGVAKGVCETFAHVGSVRDPARLLEEMNRVIFSVANTQMLMSCAAAIYDASKRELLVASAGHPSVLLLRRGIAKPLMAQGTLLGLSSDGTYESERYDTEPQDSLVWFTDGLLELENEAHEPFGEPRLRSICQRAKAHDAESLRDTLQRDLTVHLGVGLQPDDITVVIADLL
jgi:phosphoserine phosphatase RsbU/P